MRRRFTVVAALVTGALAAAVALTLVPAWQRRGLDSSVFAADAQAASAAPPPTAETVKQAPLGGGPTASLAPLVKQLRPVVVNINSKIKPRSGGRVSQRLPQGHPRLRQQPPDDEGGDEDSQDPMERFFRYFGGQPGPEQERH